MFSQVLRVSAAVLVLAVIGGCSGGDDGKFKVPPLGTVKGTITLDGKPLADASVDFVPATARASTGRTGIDGVYTLTYDESNKGAAVGEHVVKIRTKVEAGPSPELVLAKYNERSELKATVKAGDNTLDFALQSK